MEQPGQERGTLPKQWGHSACRVASNFATFEEASFFWESTDVVHLILATLVQTKKELKKNPATLNPQVRK